MSTSIAARTAAHHQNPAQTASSAPRHAASGTRQAAVQASQQTPALDLRNVTLEYPDGTSVLKAVDDVSLTLNPGEFAVLTGPSGSGKSSLLALASTLQPATRGSVVLDDVDVSGLKDKDLLKLRRESIGIIFQQPQLIASLSAVEQLTMAQAVRGGGRSAKKAARERAEELLERVGLSDRMTRRPAELSGGQRQRVNIARALMNSPKLLLVDEPTSALDQERSQAVLQLLREVTRDFGTATLLVTHDLETIDADDRLLRMVDGKLVCSEQDVR